MPTVSPTVFGFIVIGVVLAMVLYPRLKARKHHPTQHEMYFGETPTGSAAPGAPRATSPTRTAGQPAQASEPAKPAPLKLHL